MVLGCWVGDPLRVSLFCSFFLFSFYYSSFMSSPIARVGVGGCAVFASIPFFFFALLTSLSLALTNTDNVVAGVGSPIITK